MPSKKEKKKKKKKNIIYCIIKLYKQNYIFSKKPNKYDFKNLKKKMGGMTERFKVVDCKSTSKKYYRKFESCFLQNYEI